MKIISQFLYSYTDQFIKTQWVEWSEQPLAQKPNIKYRNKTGFQRVLDSSDSTIRTRAGEAYRLGLLKGPIIDGRFAKKHNLPLGWKEVINGQYPQSRLGMYAYLIGRAMQQENDSDLLNMALDTLATVQILHIGFKIDNQWYCTIAFFEFARKKLVEILNRNLNNKELRYLAGAVFNTLDDGGFEYFLSALIKKINLDSLFFSLRDETKHRFMLNEFEKLVAEEQININDIKNHKAALFWASSPRGLYSRAVAGHNKSFFNNFLEVEISNYGSGKGSTLSDTYISVENGDTLVDIFNNAGNSFAVSDELLNDWDDLVSRLDKATRLCVEKIDFSSAPPIWKYSQRSIFGQEEQTDFAQFGDDNEPKNAEQKEDTVKKEKKYCPTKAEIHEMLSNSDDIFCEKPKIEKSIDTKTRNSVRKITNRDYVEKAKRDSKLEMSGEEFVYELEIQKLSKAGKTELAKKVLWVSREIGDGIGYDILSFDNSEQHIFIEVKTTKSGQKNPFYLSSNEYNVSIEKGTKYKIYRLFNYPISPKIYIVPGPLDTQLSLTPINYLALPKETG